MKALLLPGEQPKGGAGIANIGQDEEIGNDRNGFVVAH